MLPLMLWWPFTWFPYFYSGYPWPCCVSTKKFEIWNWEELYTVAIHSEIWTFDYAEKQSPKMWCSAKIDTYPGEIDEVWSKSAQRKRIKHPRRVSKKKILQKNGARLRRSLLEQIMCADSQQSQVRATLLYFSHATSACITIFCANPFLFKMLSPGLHC